MIEAKKLRQVMDRMRVVIKNQTKGTRNKTCMKNRLLIPNMTKAKKIEPMERLS